MVIIFVSIISFLLAFIHFVIYKVLVSIFSLSITWKIITFTTLTLFALSFIFASILSFYFNNLFTRVAYTASASWLGIAFYLFLSSCIYILILYIFQIFNIDISLKYFGITCFILAITIGTYGIIHARNTNVKNINVSLENLPTSWQGKKAVWISDIHLGSVYDKNFSQKIVNKINEINPDIVFVGGDLFDGTKTNEEDAILPFRDLHPNLGIYFITGNHEEFRDNKVYLDAVKNIGFHVLSNEMVEIDGLQLIGVDDRDSKSADKMNIILSSLNIDKNKTSILLKHQPSELAEAANAGISFQISGHTHRAQVYPLSLIAKLIFKGYEYGFKMWDKMAVYTSSGVGTWGPPLRVGSDSEIVVFTLNTLEY